MQEEIDADAAASDDANLDDGIFEKFQGGELDLPSDDDGDDLDSDS